MLSYSDRRILQQFVEEAMNSKMKIETLLSRVRDINKGVTEVPHSEKYSDSPTEEYPFGLQGDGERPSGVVEIFCGSQVSFETSERKSHYVMVIDDLANDETIPMQSTGETPYWADISVIIEGGRIVHLGWTDQSKERGIPEEVMVYLRPVIQ